MTPDDLDTKTPQELTMIFAEEVAKHLKPEFWAKKDHPFVYHLAEGGQLGLFPFYATIADAVLPWLEKWQVTENAPHRSITIMRANNCERQWMVELEETTDDANTLAVSAVAFAPTFPHAAVKALIRAERAKKE